MRLCKLSWLIGTTITLPFTLQAATSDTCLGCHETVPNTTGMQAETLHALHVGRTARPEGDCLQCHDDSSNFLTAGMACTGCHADAQSKPAHVAMQPFEKASCTGCHTPENIRSKHLGAAERTAKEGLKSLVSVDVVSAKLVEDQGTTMAEVSFRLLDDKKQPITVPEGDPANAPWIKNLQLYVNWGAGVDFLSPRGYSIYVKSNKKDITQKGGGRTPAGERERTPIWKTNGEVFTYRVGPVTVQDDLSGDRSKDLGVISDRLIYCFDPAKKLISCDKSGNAKNAAWNHVWAFNAEGLVDEQKLTAIRPEIVSNAKCGTCHGYDTEHDETQIACRSCHSQKTAKNKLLADTTCFSGHDDKDGKHVPARDVKVLSKRALPGFAGSTNDLTVPCVTCHNANTPPTAALRERFVVSGDQNFIVDLILSHPDHKMWMHTLHANTRPSQRDPESVRRVSYSVSTSDCTRCHEGNSFGIERLLSSGRPLALDLDYDSDSSVHPAIDFQVDAYASPVGSTCLGCHAFTTDEKGAQMRNTKAVQHMIEQGARFGVAKKDLVKENCGACHTTEALAASHNLKR